MMMGIINTCTTITTRSQFRACFSHLAFEYVGVITVLQLLDMVSCYNETKYFITSTNEYIYKTYDIIRRRKLEDHNK